MLSVCLAPHERDIGKHRWPRASAASLSILFALNTQLSMKYDTNNTNQTSLLLEMDPSKGLWQKPTPYKWVKWEAASEKEYSSICWIRRIRWYYASVYTWHFLPHDNYIVPHNKVYRLDPTTFLPCHNVARQVCFLAEYDLPVLSTIKDLQK